MPLPQIRSCFAVRFLPLQCLLCRERQAILHPLIVNSATLVLLQEVLADSSAIVSRLAAEAEAAKAAQQPGRKGWFGRDSAPLAAPQPSPASLGEAGLAPGHPQKDAQP